jgi:hypothetical protein
MNDFDYFENTLNAHLNNYFSGAADVCVTGLSEVAIELAAKSIPHHRVLPTQRALLSSVSKLHTKITSIESKSNTAVIIIGINTEHSEDAGKDVCDELRRDYEAAAIAKSLAVRLDSDLIPCRNGTFMIYCDRDILISETDDFHTVFFSQLSLRQTLLNFSVGIGLGSTIKDANENARLAFSKASASRDSVAYVAFDATNIRGPLEIRPRNNADSASSASFASVLMNMGFGQENAHKMASIIEASSTKRFTIKELSNKSGISSRAVTRVVQSLEDAGYCTSVGMQVGVSAGRPARVLGFNV